MLDGKETGTYRIQAGDYPITDENGESRITVADYASAIVDEPENGTSIRKRFTAAY